MKESKFLTSCSYNFHNSMGQKGTDTRTLWVFFFFYWCSNILAALFLVLKLWPLLLQHSTILAHQMDHEQEFITSIYTGNCKRMFYFWLFHFSNFLLSFSFSSTHYYWLNILKYVPLFHLVTVQRLVFALRVLWHSIIIIQVPAHTVLGGL